MQLRVKDEEACRNVFEALFFKGEILEILSFGEYVINFIPVTFMLESLLISIHLFLSS